ncbi:hypothetical protein Fcan01_11292 [Folsomia candida]|uniref:Uncharacterized protein n=1 Tax=Folsomia candida TaxID=158441 RepID=A0A226EDB9_FOLCA|nr:hypothetical protein Fcan01_11292 [Folsomia candida]
MSSSLYENWTVATIERDLQPEVSTTLPDFDPPIRTRISTPFRCVACIGKTCVIFFLLGLIVGIFALPISMIVVGWKHVDECPAEELPIILMVGGLIFLIQIIVIPCFKKDGGKYITGFVALVELGWLLAAAVLLYRTDFVTDDLQNPNYCRPVVYYFTWWMVSIIIGCSGVTIMMVLCVTYREKCKRFCE